MLFQEDDRVILISHFYGCSETNPVWESDHACIGTITGFLHETGALVEWDNGRRNSYNIKYLDHYTDVDVVLEKNNPNTAFRMERARRERTEKKGGIVWDLIALKPVK
jgi:hypothetical protein